MTVRGPRRLCDLKDPLISDLLDNLPTLRLSPNSWHGLMSFPSTGDLALFGSWDSRGHTIAFEPHWATHGGLGGDAKSPVPARTFPRALGRHDNHQSGAAIPVVHGTLCRTKTDGTRWIGDLTKVSEPDRIKSFRLIRLEAQDIALSRLRHGFEVPYRATKCKKPIPERHGLFTFMACASQWTPSPPSIPKCCDRSGRPPS